MCGRFTLTVDDIARLAREWAAEVDATMAERWRARYNVAPLNPHPVLRTSHGRRALISATFGHSTPRGLKVNVRTESLSSRPPLHEALLGGRVAVPADGFFEWEGPRGARMPTYFQREGGRPFFFAALLGLAPDGSPGFAILTAPARAPVRALHDRMPVVLPEGLVPAWLDEGPPPALPDPMDGELIARRVSDRVNSVGNDDPACLADRAAPVQGVLF